MEEVQNLGEQTHPLIKRRWPLVVGISLIPVSVIFLKYFSVPSDWPGMIVWALFPYGPLVFFSGHGDDIPYLPMIAVVLQFPVYGLIFSTVSKLKTAVAIVAVAHTLAVFLLAALLVLFALTFKLF